MGQQFKIAALGMYSGSEINARGVQRFKIAGARAVLRRGRDVMNDQAGLPGRVCCDGRKLF